MEHYRKGHTFCFVGTQVAKVVTDEGALYACVLQRNQILALGNISKASFFTHNNWGAANLGVPDALSHHSVRLIDSLFFADDTWSDSTPAVSFSPSQIFQGRSQTVIASAAAAPLEGIRQLKYEGFASLKIECRLFPGPSAENFVAFEAPCNFTTRELDRL